MQAGEAAAKKTQQNTQEINDELKFGEKRRQLDFENNQLMLKNEVALRKQYATEFERIDLETAEQAQLLINETKRKDQQEAGKFAVENARILSQQLYALDLSAQEKRNDLRKKQEAKIREEQYAFAQEMEQAFTQELIRRSDIVKSITLQTQAERESLEYEMQKLMLKNSLIGASDKVVQLAMLELETQKKIAEINANSDLDPSEKARQAVSIRRNQGMQEMFISMQDSLKATQRVYDAVFGNMEKALENFVRTGKLSFKDLARSIIQDLILIQLKASATMLFNSFLRSMGFSFGSASGGTITGGSGLIPRASGGAVSAGTSYMVGERGPEMFVPRTSGTIVPNNALSSVGGSQVINNYNIQAIDVKSFEDRIMGSSTAVWAANAYANKSLAIGRGRA
jgi:lambda family phage tail tape measure protein